MKKYILILLLFSTNCLFSQSYDNASFSPSGAKWLYNALAWGSTDHHIIEYESDTLISGRDVKKMKYYINHYTFTGPNQDIIVKNVEELGNLYFSESNFRLCGNYRFEYVCLCECFYSNCRFTRTYISNSNK